MKFPVPALLIALGILFLWVAITGRLDRLLTGFQYVTGGTDTLPSVASGAGTGAGTAAGGMSLVDPSALHVSSVMQALPAVVALSSLN
jgi:hypothetical protein